MGHSTPLNLAGKATYRINPFDHFGIVYIAVLCSDSEIQIGSSITPTVFWHGWHDTICDFLEKRKLFLTHLFTSPQVEEIKSSVESAVASIVETPKKEEAKTEVPPPLPASPPPAEAPVEEKKEEAPPAASPAKEEPAPVPVSLKS